MPRLVFTRVFYTARATRVAASVLHIDFRIGIMEGLTRHACTERVVGSRYKGLAASLKEGNS
jgi:hypothetical protein